MPTESFSSNFSTISSSSNSMSGLEELSPVNMKVVYCVLLDMALSFFGILCNLLVVTTIRHHEEMQNSTTNLLLINLCFSNLLISFLVKPISAIYAGYSMSTGSWQVSLVFCSMFTMIYRTTWCILPFTIVAFSWLYILPVIWLPQKCKIWKQTSRPSSCQPSESRSTSLLAVPANSIPSSSSSTPAPAASCVTPPEDTSSYFPGTLSPVPAPLSPDTKRRLAELSDDLTMNQKVVLGAIWIIAALYGITTCFPEKVFPPTTFVKNNNDNIYRFLVLRC